jgi:type II secretory pathway component GspD/PulD (secretin)
MLRRFVITCVIGASAIGSPAQTQPVETIDLAGQIELARLVDLASERLYLNIEYDAQALKGTVTLRLGGDVTDDELWTLVNRLLSARGWTTVRMGDDGTLSVVKLADAASVSEITQQTTGDQVPPGYRVIVRRIEHADVADVVSAVEPLLGASGSISRLGTTSLVLIADLQTRAARALSLIELLDSDDEEVSIEQVSLSHLDAEGMVAIVGQVRAKAELVGRPDPRGEILPAPDDAALLVIAPASEVPKWRILIQSLDKREPVQTRTYSARFFGIDAVAELVQESIDTAGDPRFKLVADELTGTLVITATASIHERIKSIIDRLDAVTPEARRQVRTIIVNNRNVTDLVSVIDSLLSTGVLGVAAEAVELPEQPTEPEPTPPPKKPEPPSEPSLAITADERTSSIIAMGPPRLLDELELLVRQLDVRQPQVMLEVLLVALTDSQARDLGVELQGQFEVGATSVSLASLFGLGAPLLSGGSDEDPQRASGLTGLVLKPGDFSVLIRALETINRGRTLTMPRVLVTNNEEALLDSVNQQPTTSINASETVSTTSFAGFEPAGTQITLRPQIAEADHLVIEYTVSLSSFEGESSQEGVPPPRQENRIQSVATIPDGYTIVVGGIEVVTNGKSETRVPILGAIPLIGEAFKSRSRSSNRVRFYAFIRPTVLRNEDFEDLKFLSESHVAAAKIDDNWPRVEPRLIR